MNKTTILLTEPQLSIQACNDGVWLHFSTTNGLHSSINLPIQFGRDSSINNYYIQEWCRQYAKKIEREEEAS